MGSFKVYSKNSGQWKTMYYEKEDESTSDLPGTLKSNEKNIEIPGHLKIGQKISGWGKVAGPKECARECIAGKKPKICYYHWTVEYYRTLGGACNMCVPKTNSSIATDCQCILADGVDVAGLLSVNRMYPGPSVQVCLGDLVVVDLHNAADGNELTIHWHGIYQMNYQYYDGVPFVTQYQWRAQNIGTHWWHSHSGLQKAKTLEGAVIVRQPKEYDANYRLYDHDDTDNLIFLSDWMHDSPDDHFPGTSGKLKAGQSPDNALINGQGQWLDKTTGTWTNTSLNVVNVTPGKRYRFRMINAGSFSCPFQLTIQNHSLTVIAADGENVKPTIVNSITTLSAERFDFILNANQQLGSYWIQVRLTGSCASRQIIQLGILRYAGSTVLNEFNTVCDGNNPDLICMKNLKAAEPVDKRILAEKIDVQFYLPFEFHRWNETELYTPGTYKPFLAPNGGGSGVIPMINGISNKFPTSPFLTQANDIDKKTTCDGNNKPKSCDNSSICLCTHVLHIRLNSSVEMIMFDPAANGVPHPLHMHGYGFHVMAQGSRKVVNITRENSYEALKLDREIYKLDSHDRPPVKDTLTVGYSHGNGYTVVQINEKIAEIGGLKAAYFAYKKKSRSCGDRKIAKFKFNEF
ncbi:hypothetical protein HCN44_010211 [Aphidius gifuensis]|uniref:Laccase n=1 Tax=Aphidius gifuensis TaxID=684658 RepID=A0A834XZB6_APHGI|nr:hypothetical protein HCN44_010211 [Aphidius gifuensis]